MPGRDKIFEEMMRHHVFESSFPVPFPDGRSYHTLKDEPFAVVCRDDGRRMVDMNALGGGFLGGFSPEGDDFCTRSTKQDLNCTTSW